MIWIFSVLLLLVGGGLANPVKGRRVSEVNNSNADLQGTVKEIQKSIQVLYSKLQVVENEVRNGETS